MFLQKTYSSVLLFHTDLPTLRLTEHKAFLLRQQNRAHFGLFDQLNTAVDGEHFHLLSAGLRGISNTRKQKHIYKPGHPQAAGLLSMNLTDRHKDDSFTLQYNDTSGSFEV